MARPVPPAMDHTVMVLYLFWIAVCPQLYNKVTSVAEDIEKLAIPAWAREFTCYLFGVDDGDLSSSTPGSLVRGAAVFRTCTAATGIAFEMLKDHLFQDGHFDVPIQEIVWARGLIRPNRLFFPKSIDTREWREDKHDFVIVRQVDGRQWVIDLTGEQFGIERQLWTYEEYAEKWIKGGKNGWQVLGEEDRRMALINRTSINIKDWIAGKSLKEIEEMTERVRNGDVNGLILDRTN